MAERKKERGRDGGRERERENEYITNSKVLRKINIIYMEVSKSNTQITNPKTPICKA